MGVWTLNYKNKLKGSGMDHFQSSSIASKALFGYCLFCSKLKTENTVTNHFKS